jgi:DNA-binding transcriptional LysR family regulator
MRGSEFADLKAFATVAEEASFSRAARRLGISPSALSQTMRALEERLHTRLLNRTTRSVTMTAAGSAFFDRVKPLFTAFEEALAEVGGLSQEPSGLLRVNSSRTAAMHFLAPLLGTFNRSFPDIVLEIAIEDALTDIVAGRFDVGIRLGERLEKDMIAIKLGGDLKTAVVMAPALLQRLGTPETPRDLQHFPCIRFRWPGDKSLYHWEFERQGRSLRTEVDGPMIVNDTDLMVQAALDGVGIAYLLDQQAQPYIDTGALVHIMPEWMPSFGGFYLYHSSRRQTPPQLRAFIDFLKEHINGSGHSDQRR